MTRRQLGHVHAGEKCGPLPHVLHHLGGWLEQSSITPPLRQPLGVTARYFTTSATVWSDRRFLNRPRSLATRGHSPHVSRSRACGSQAMRTPTQPCTCVSTRQVYVEGLVKQASNDQYWDIWKRQKLSPELELKRQRILDTYQGLTDQLIGLEKHFNNLEISKFGEHGGVHAGRRALHANAFPSRNGQSVQKMYNTLNSQLAATEQLSNCLSEQMAMLNINKQSVRHPTVVKELFESIGISQEASIFHSPEPIKGTLVSASITKGNSKINMSSTSQVLESGTARRRYSLDKSLSKFEPQKTTVKRMLKESAVSVIADKHVGRSREAFHSQTASFVIDPQKINENHASSLSQSSSLKWHSPAYPTGKGIQEKPPKVASEPQSVSPFKWTLELSGSSQNLKSNSHPGQPLSSSSSTVVYNNPHGMPDGKFQLPDSSNNIVTHTVSQSGSSMVSKTAPSSKRMSNVPFNTSPQTSVAFPSSCTTNFKTTLPSEIMHEKTSGQLNQQAGKDAPTKLSVRSLDNFGVSEKGLFFYLMSPLILCDLLPNLLTEIELLKLMC
ncbi:nuclear pore complex protein NUP214-like [Dioscorea cayenensis subsp. rotundata]|uniref:Nuclear pore complex protein NUP214-like n=1 Tax=Dioscorea cayennensis subsp. rotundata TaxID=55577 RepID=A0AB40C8W7_DIOCR|nr:nuclear pore complex protein NUP214-like [Dioscorea cayenensis subsp. rotundata]